MSESRIETALSFEGRLLHTRQTEQENPAKAIAAAGWLEDGRTLLHLIKRLKEDLASYGMPPLREARPGSIEAFSSKLGENYWVANMYDLPGSGLVAICWPMKAEEGQQQAPLFVLAEEGVDDEIADTIFSTVAKYGKQAAA